MVLLGLLLLVLSAVAVLGAIFLLDSSGVEYFGADVPAVTLFVVGALSVVFIGTGVRLMASGTKRNLRARKELKRAERAQAERAQTEQAQTEQAQTEQAQADGVDTDRESPR
ncbi:hypothetical protein ncot_17765 [Nocardioides sp. JQ2195]|uniref:hypothetical protein n=1 Tax=Nocardioides sp. JQ2195 TaxID=2592334 RepID=UPI00143E7528|nr:hypothetical protein [Nocardioides sp. JQ2195]QIX28230.1 hypothetical protein ncot_17765 [Nocardioides sp. JQ2195]